MVSLSKIFYKKMQQSQPKWEMKGKIFTFDFVNKLIAFTNDIQSDKVIIYIGGLGDTLLSTPFTSELSDFCTNNNVTLIIPQFKSMPNYRIFSISSDVEDLRKIVEQNKNKQIILLGHSTGCQVSMLYLKAHGSQGIRKVILQAPVSDVEYQQSINENLKEELQQARNSLHFVPGSDGKIWLSERFLTLNQRFNTEDWFSTHLADENYLKWKQYGIPIVSIIGGADKYVVNSSSEVFVIHGATHSLYEKQSRLQFFKIIGDKL